MPPRPRLAIAFITACTAAITAYALLRVGQSLAVTEANPAQIIYSEHAAYFWRSWTAAYAGALLGFAAWIWPYRSARALPPGIIVATGLLALQSVFIP